MTMLSRVAERLYWMGRYFERTEVVARLTSNYTHLIMDLPKKTAPEWLMLVRTLAVETSFFEHYRAANELNVLRFTLSELDNPCSIISSIKAARENVRTTRDVLPEELWEHVNELYLYARDQGEASVGRRMRHSFLDEIIARCQMISGLLTNTLCRDHAMRFLKLGYLLERADMTTRVIDVGSEAILSGDNKLESMQSLLWGNLLHSLSAMSAYRRLVSPIAEPQPMIQFLFKEPSFPRSFMFCLNGIQEALHALNNNNQPLRAAHAALNKLNRLEDDSIDLAQLHAFIDELQSALIALHNSLSATWFQIPEMAQSQS